MFVEDPPVRTKLAPREAAPEDLETEHLEHEIEQLAARMAADTCRWLELVAEFDRRNGWSRWGTQSCAHWVSWRCALSLRAAREQVRVARSLTDLSATRAAFARGELSYSKVRALTRVATAESEENMLELATHATAAQLERLVRAFRRVGPAEAQREHDNRYLRKHWDDHGSLCISARLPAEEGALVLRALDAARDTLREREGECGTGPDGRDEAVEPTQTGGFECSAEHSDADALALVAETALGAGELHALPAGERSQLVVHVDLERLAAMNGEADRVEGQSRLRDGPAVSAETARRLGCDGALVTLLECEGEPLSVGRRTRAVPAAMRRALAARDGCCRFPGCENSRIVDAHHVHHWARGGETSLDNLILLCRSHHRLLHEGGFTLRRRPDGTLCFMRPDGRPVSSPSARPGRPRAAPAGRLRTGSGERMDLHLAVQAMLAASDP